MGFYDKRESILGVPRWQKDWRALFYTFWLFFKDKTVHHY